MSYLLVHLLLIALLLGGVFPAAYGTSTNHTCRFPPCEQWRASLNFTCKAGPVRIGKGTRLFLAGDNFIALIDYSQEGKVLWRRDISPEKVEYGLDLIGGGPFGVSSSNNKNNNTDAAEPDLIVYQTSYKPSHDIVAVSVVTGEERWRIKGSATSANYGYRCAGNSFLVLTGIVNQNISLTRLYAIRLADGSKKVLADRIDGQLWSAAGSNERHGLFVAALQLGADSVLWAYRPADAFSIDPDKNNNNNHHRVYRPLTNAMSTTNKKSHQNNNNNIQPVWKRAFPNLNIGVFSLFFVQNNDAGLVVLTSTGNGDQYALMVSVQNEGKIVWNNQDWNAKNTLGGFMAASSKNNIGVFGSGGASNEVTHGVSLANGKILWTYNFIPDFVQFEGVSIQGDYLLAYMGFENPNFWPFAILNVTTGTPFVNASLPSPGLGPSARSNDNNPLPIVFRDEYYFFLFNEGVAAAKINRSSTHGGRVNQIWMNQTFWLTTHLRLYDGKHLILTFSPSRGDRDHLAPGDGFVSGFDLSGFPYNN